MRSSNKSKKLDKRCFLKNYKKYKVKSVSIIGFLIKNNASLKNSPSIHFLKTIKNTNLKISIYDDLIKKYKNIDISKIENTTKNPDVVIFARDFVNSDLIVKRFFNKNKIKILY